MGTGWAWNRGLGAGAGRASSKDVVSDVPLPLDSRLAVH